MSDEPFGDRLERVLRKRLRRITAFGPDALDRGRSRALHRLRLAVKALRYDLEFVVPIVRERTTEPLRLLALFQERLGAIEDAAAFARTYALLLAALPANDVRRVGVETLRIATERDGGRALEEARRIWRGAPPDAFPYPERLAASISAALGSLSPNVDPSFRRTVASNATVRPKARSKRSRLNAAPSISDETS
jgi:hypothetical protein